MNENNQYITEERLLALFLLNPTTKNLPSLDCFSAYYRPVADLLFNAPPSRWTFDDWYMLEWDDLDLPSEQKLEMWHRLAMVSQLSMSLELTKMRNGFLPITFDDLCNDLRKDNLKSNAIRTLESMLKDLQIGADLRQTLANGMRNLAKIGKELVS